MGRDMGGAGGGGGGYQRRGIVCNTKVERELLSLEVSAGSRHLA